jgi:hypothetical protein
MAIGDGAHRTEEAERDIGVALKQDLLGTRRDGLRERGQRPLAILWGTLMGSLEEPLEKGRPAPNNLQLNYR